MKIAHVTCAYPPYPSGISNAVFEIAKQNIRLGHDVAVFTPDYGRGGNAPTEAVLLKPLVKLGNAAFLPQLFWLVLGFDAVVVHYPFFGGAETAWLGLLGRKKPKLIVHYHMDTPSLSRPAKLLNYPLQPFKRLIIGKAERIICASLDYIRQSSISRYHSAHPDKFVEIPFGVDLARFRPAGEPPKALKEILFVGGLDKAHAFKGVDILLGALAIAGNQAFEWRLTIIGDGDLRPAYEKSAVSLGLSGRVRFAGSVSNQELPAFFRMSDLFVLPSVSVNEAFGMVLLAAMASGVPVVASNLPGVRSVFEDGEQGLRAEPGDAADLAEKLSRLLSDDDLRQRMSASARRTAEQRYDWNRIGEMYDKALTTQ